MQYYFAIILSEKRLIDKNLFMQDNDLKHNAKIL